MEKKIIIISLMLTTCLGLLAQQSNKSSYINQLKTKIDNILEIQNEQIMQLEAKTEEIQKDMDYLGKDVEHCRQDIRDKTSSVEATIARMDASLDHWLVVMALIVTAISAISGILIPILINNNTEKRIDEKYKTALENAKSAENALSEIKALQDKFKEIEKNNELELNTNVLFSDGAKARACIEQARMENDNLKKLKFYEKAIGYNPQNEVAYRERAGIWLKFKDYENAVKDMNESIKLNPDDIESYSVRAEILEKMGKFQEAINDYSILIDRSNSIRHKYYFKRRAHLYKELKKYDKAIEDFSSIIKEYPLDLYSYLDRAELYELSSNYEKAIEDYKSISIYWPSYSYSYQNLAHCYEEWAKIENDKEKKSELIGYAKENIKIFMERERAKPKPLIKRLFGRLFNPNFYY